MESTLRTNISELWAKAVGCLALLNSPDNADKRKETVEDGWGQGY